MTNNIVIFAGGKGTRLNNTESKPKPLVDINGKSLISRLIISLNNTNIFCKFHILTCQDSNLFNEVLGKEIFNINFEVYDEGKRSGRVGAIKYFLKIQNTINRFFICNGDTLFLNLKRKEISIPINQSISKPIAYLVNSDNSRNDYQLINLKKNNKLQNYQNSGLIYLSRDWFNLALDQEPNFTDIDEYLFKEKNSCSYSILSTEILDGGTPARLSKIRNLIF